MDKPYCQRVSIRIQSSDGDKASNSTGMLEFRGPDYDRNTMENALLDMRSCMCVTIQTLAEVFSEFRGVDKQELIDKFMADLVEGFAYYVAAGLMSFEEHKKLMIKMEEK